MVIKDTILYFEDEFSIREGAKEDLEEAFPSYKILANYRGDKEVVDEIIRELNSIDRIAIVCTDGRLAGSYGWDVVEELRRRDYNGPALYTGGSELPQDKQHLYVGEAQKTGEGLVSKVKEVLNE